MPEPVGSLPSVTLAIPTHNGSRLLSECLESVEALEYPRELLETIVVDNASTDETPDVLAAAPWVRVLRQSRNLGFAEAVDVAAGASKADCLAVANDDMRFDAGWLRELVAAYEPAGDYRCVGGLILDVAGRHVDFADGYIGFDGSAGQIGYGRPIGDVAIVDGRELPFACGGSMLVDRKLFLELGGFDPAFFAYFEDVDFGWRLWLAGYKVRLAARARSFHHHSATGLRMPRHQRTVLHERNALLMLAKNVGEPDVYRFLAAALCLVAERARVASHTDPTEFEFGVPVEGDDREVPLRALGRLYGIAGFAGGLEDALAKRAEVQALRRRSDEEIFALFRHPFRPIYHEESYLEAEVAIARAFGIVDRFPRRRLTRLLYVAPDRDERSRALARSLARYASVVQLAPDGAATGPDVEIIDSRRADLEELVRECDAVVVRPGAPGAAAAARAAHGLRPLVVDAADGPLASHDVGADAVLVLHGDSDEALRLLVEEPWKTGLQPETTEDLQVLATLRRNPPPRPEPATSPGVFRRVWSRVPEPVRRPLRPVLCRLRG
jgi:GT2 family glycosyltransferase